MKSSAHPGVTVGRIIEAMETLAPPFLAEEWDNCGLQVGSRSWPVQRVWLGLDPLSWVVRGAVHHKIDLLITHHPLLFQPLRSIDLQTAVGRIIETALSARLAIYAAHTNLDSAAQGVNDALAEAVGLVETIPLVDAPHADGLTSVSGPVGMGRLGRLRHAESLQALAENIRTRLGIGSVKFAGNPELMVERVAVCSGSGASLLHAFLKTGAQVYVTGDLRYHDARAVEEAGRGLIDIGHFHSEHLVLARLADRLGEMVRLKRWPVMIEVCPLERDPFITH